MSTHGKTRSAAAFAAIVIAAVSFGGAAQAVSKSCASSTTFSLSDATSAQCFSGNDTNTINSAFSMFGMTGWILADKNDDNSSGNQAISFLTAPVNGAKSGAWGISGLADKVVVTLKAGNGFGAFLLEQPKLTGNWSSGKDLSHASIYYTGETSVSEVPLPAAGLLLLGALGGLGVAGRRRRNAV